MTITAFNQLPDLTDLLSTACGSSTWAAKMAASTPYLSLDQLLLQGHQVWSQSSEEDWLEAFKHHPEIGNLESLKRKYSSGKELSEKEQAQVSIADDNVLKSLATQNQSYKSKFGFIFIVFATGKSASEMLDLLNARINNSRSEEIQNAMEEQWKITKLRLENLIS